MQLRRAQSQVTCGCGNAASPSTNPRDQSSAKATPSTRTTNSNLLHVLANSMHEVSVVTHGPHHPDLHVLPKMQVIASSDMQPQHQENGWVGGVLNDCGRKRNIMLFREEESTGHNLGKMVGNNDS